VWSCSVRERSAERVATRSQTEDFRRDSKAYGVVESEVKTAEDLAGRGKGAARKMSSKTD